MYRVRHRHPLRVVTKTSLAGSAIRTVLVLTIMTMLASGVVGETVRAQFTFEVRNKTVSFKDTSLGINIAAHEWDFGDKSYSYLSDPEHTYAGYGNYTVTLRVTTSTGVVNTTWKLVEVPRNGSASSTTTILVYGFAIATFALLVGVVFFQAPVTRFILFVFAVFLIILTLLLVSRGTII